MQNKIQSQKRTSSSKVVLASKRSHARAERCTNKNPSTVEEPSTLSSFKSDVVVSGHNYEEDEEECTGLEWVQCVCARRIYKKCVSEVVSDEQGHELLCPFCVI